MKKCLFLIILLCAINNAFADTIHQKPFVFGSENQFKITKCIIPVTLFTIGACGISDKPYPNTLPKARTCWGDDFVACFNPAIYFCLNGKNNINNKFLTSSVTYATALALTLSLKSITNEPRPTFDDNKNNSFPSRHTAIAFAGAELIRLDCGWMYGTLAYLVAGSTAYLRYYHNKHWINDLFGGAGIGILSANIGYWLLPYTNSIFTKRNKKNVSFSPIYFPSEKMVGMSISANI